MIGAPVTPLHGFQGGWKRHRILYFLRSHPIVASALMATALVVLLAAPRIAYAEASGCTLSPSGWDVCLNVVLNHLFSLYVSFLGSLMLWVANAIVSVAQYNGWGSAIAVNIGWVLVRDIANMFFVVVLLIIAFGTMFGVQKYDYKALLPRFVLMALLINFSKTIALLIIDVGQVIMLTFVSAFSASAGGNFAQAFGITEWFKFSSQAGEFTKIDLGGAVTSHILAAVLVTVALSVLVVFLIILLFRIVQLWLAIILAPMAFMLSTFPKGKEYYDRWWKEFLNAVIVGPVLAFFLWLTLVTTGSGVQELVQAPVNCDEVKNLSIGVSEAGNICNPKQPMILFLTAVAMLLLSLKITQEFGVAGTDFAMKMGKGVQGLGVKFAKTVSGTAALQRTWESYKAQRAQAKKEGAAASLGERLGVMQNYASVGFLAGKFTGKGSRAEDRIRGYRDKQISEQQKRAEGWDNAKIQDMAKNGHRGAMVVAGQRGLVDTAAQAQQFQRALGGSRSALQSFTDALRKSAPQFVYDLSTVKGRDEFTKDVEAGRASLKSLDTSKSATTVTPADMSALVSGIIEGKTSAEIESIRKGITNAATRKEFTDALKGAGATPTGDPLERQKAYVSITGDIAASGMNDSQQVAYMKDPQNYSALKDLKNTSLNDASVARNLAEALGPNLGRFIKDISPTATRELQKGMDAAQGAIAAAPAGSTLAPYQSPTAGTYTTWTPDQQTGYNVRTNAAKMTGDMTVMNTIELQQFAQNEPIANMTGLKTTASTATFDAFIGGLSPARLQQLARQPGMDSTFLTDLKARILATIAVGDKRRDTVDTDTRWAAY